MNLLTCKKDTENLGRLMQANSGKIIGAVVKALDLDQDILKERTARRFFSGHSINERNRAQIFKSIGEVFVERGLVSNSKFLSRFNTTMPEIIGQAVEEAAERWDHLLSVTQSHSVSVVNIDKASEQILRLVVVDLAIRAFALMRLSGVDSQAPDTPLWAKENGTRDMLRGLVKRSGMTRQQVAEQVQVSDNSIDNWLDGKVRPTRKNVERLADVLVDEDSLVAKRKLEQEIHRTFALAELVDFLADFVERERIIEISTALNRFVWFITEEVNQTKRSPIEENPTAELVALVYGTAHRSTRDLLEILTENETDKAWSEAILYAAIDWNIAFQKIAVKSGQGRTAAGLAQDLLDVETRESEL